MKKIIFFDIDGTIATEDERGFIPDSTRRAIAQARANGHLTFINSGRTIFNIGNNIRELGFDGYICGCGTYIEYNDEVLLYNKLDRQYCRKIADLLYECKVMPAYEHRDCIFFDKRIPDTNEMIWFKEKFLEPIHDRFHDVSDDDFSFDKFIFWRSSNDKFDVLIQKIGSEFMFIDRGDGLFEVVPKGFTKATGIRFILDRLGIPLKNAFAIGDSPNDLPMLEAVPNSIAIGGAERIYPYVSFITKPLEENGIEYALKHFGII